MSIDSPVLLTEQQFTQGIQLDQLPRALVHHGGISALL